MTRAATVPGSNKSAGWVKSARARPGNRYLKGALGTAALPASRSKSTYIFAKYRRIAPGAGPSARRAPTFDADRNPPSNGDLYQDPGTDYFSDGHSARTMARGISRLEALGFHVNLQPLADTA